MLVEKSGFDTRMVMIMQDMACKWDAMDSIPVVRSAFDAITRYLVELRSKEDVTHTLVLKNDFKEEESNIIFAASLEKNKSDEGKSYALTFVCDAEDIPKDTKIVNILDRDAFEFIDKTMNDNPRDSYTFNVKTGGSRSLYYVLRGIVLTLSEFGREALNNDDNTIIFKGYFTLGATVDDNGKVHIKITPSEELKQLIKDDSTIEGAEKKKEESSENKATEEAVTFQA